MGKSYNLLLLLLFVFSGLFAQRVDDFVPQAVNYQALARDQNGNPLVNQPIAVQFTVLEGSATGPIRYKEEHFTTTNFLGLFNLEIGRGIVVRGDFSTIEWGVNPHFMMVEMDQNGGTGYELLGVFELISVPYALHARTADYIFNDKDEQQLSFANDSLYLTNSTAVYIPPSSDDQGLILSNDTLYIENGTGWVYLEDYRNDADSDPTNEIQDLQLSGNILTITNNWSATQIDLTSYLDNTDAQALSLSNDTLYLTNGGQVYLGNYLSDLDEQQLSISNDTLYLTNGGQVYLGDFFDNTDEQALGFSGDTLYLTNGGWVYLGDYLDDTDQQTLSYNPTTGELSISNGNAVSILLPDDWGTQVVQSDNTISGDGTGVNPLSIAQQGAISGQVLTWNGSTWVPDNVADGDSTNEIQDLTITGNILTITNNPNASPIDLGPYLDNTDEQTLSYDPQTGVLTISNGNGVNLPIPIPDDWGTQVAQTDNTISGDGTSANPLGVAQQGATSGQVLTWDGTTWTPQNNLDNDSTNEIQDLNIDANNILTITENGNPTQIDLNPFLDNTDNQTLSFDPATGVITISNGNSISIPLNPGGDDWGAQVAITNPTLAGDGTTTNPLKIAQQGATPGQVLKWNGTTWLPQTDFDNNPGNEIQDLKLTGTILTITQNFIATPIDLAPFLDNTDQQTLSFDPVTGILTISNGNSVNIPLSPSTNTTPPDNWGTQAAETTPRLTGDGTIANPLDIAQQGATNGQVLMWNGTSWVPSTINANYQDPDNDPTNEIQLLSFNPATGILAITGGNGVQIPLSSGGDNWGAQTAQTDATIDGDGTSSDPLKIAQQGAGLGQVLTWNGTTWMPATLLDNDSTNEIQDL